MSNPEDLATLRTEKGRDAIAEGIYSAFCSFKGRYDGVEVIPPAPAAAESQAQPEQAEQAVKEESSVQYGIQVLAIGKKMDLKDPYFRGYTPLVIPAGKMNKYVMRLKRQKGA